MTENDHPDAAPGDVSEPSNVSLLESLLDEFEAAWVEQPFPELQHYLSRVSPEMRPALLAELIQIDMERRWRSMSLPANNDPLPCRPRLEDYIAALPELGSVNIVPLDMIIGEFRVRQLWGDRPAISDLVARFPHRSSEIEAACAALASELSCQSPRNVPPQEDQQSLQADPPSGSQQVQAEPDVDAQKPSAEQSFQTLTAGMQISHYMLQSKLGEGGCGVVFLAQNIDRPYQRCAIKLIRPDRLAVRKMQERFQQEIKALSGLSHPNIVCAEESGNWNGVSYLVMEYVEGDSLSRLIARRRQIAVADACEMIRQAAIGLQHIHEKKRTHRDIKPSNLVLTPDGIVKILDLGMARLTDIDDPDERLTSFGDVMGTPDYMAPEQWEDSSNVDIRGDIYSLGCTLYCLLAASPPYANVAGRDPVALMRAHVESPVPDVSKVRNDVPPELASLIRQCMAKQVKDRPDEPRDLVELLEPYAADADVSAVPAKHSVDHGDGNSSPFLVRGQRIPGNIDSANKQTIDKLPATPTGHPPETITEPVPSTRDPAQEETLIQRQDELENTHAEQTIKPVSPLETLIERSAASPETARPQSSSTSSVMSSYSTSGSVVIRQREVTHGRPSGGAVAEYEIGRLIGAGGMGAVYQAKQGSIDRTVALKMIKGQKIPPDAQEKFLAEAVITGTLEHPNIVPIYDLGANSSGQPFYAMKEVRGEPWRTTIDTVSMDENIEVLFKVADAIAFAHSKGIAHRDLKPDNVMIGEFGEVLVMDWGLALPTAAFEKPGFSIARGPAGTPSYMAPEMAGGPWNLVGTTSDVYLLGALLFRFVTGKPPHTGRHAMAALRAAASNIIEWPEATDAAKLELLDIARKAMATLPLDRYSSALDFQAALRDYRSHSESRRLTDLSFSELAEGQTSGEYRRFEKAILGLEEALELWPDNQRASEGLRKARMSYAQTAFNRQDLELAESQLDEHNEAQRQLLGEIRQARADRDAQGQRTRRLKQLAAGLAAAVFLTVCVSAGVINNARRNEAHAKTEAVERFKDSQSSIKELSELADALSEYPLAQVERQQLLQAVTRYYERQTSELSDVPELKLEQLRSLIRLGAVQNQLAQYASATTTWNQASDLALKLEADTTLLSEASFLRSQAGLGKSRTFLAQGSLNEARDALLAATDQLQKLTESKFNRDVHRQLAEARVQLALIEKTSGNYLAARSSVALAIEAFQEIPDGEKNVAVRRGIASAHGINVQILELIGEYRLAAESAGQAISVWQQLSEESPTDIVTADGLATSQIDRANVRRAAGHDPLADYQDSVASFDRLVELRPGIPRYRFNLGTGLTGLAWTQNRLGQTALAQETAVRSVNTFLFLAERFPEDARFPLGEVSARLTLAEILRDRGELDLSVEIVGAANATLYSDAVPVRIPETRERGGELLLLYGQLQSTFGQSELALEAFHQAVTELNALAAEESGLSRHHDAVAWAEFYLAHELSRSGQPDSAATAIGSAIQRRGQLPERATWLDSFAWLLLYSPAEALRDQDRAETLARQAVELAGASARIRRTLALAQLRTGRFADASQTLELSKQLTTHEHPEQGFLEAMLAAKQQQADMGIGLFSSAAELMDETSPDNPRLLLIRQEAAALTGAVDPVSQAVPVTQPGTTN
jgi:serine/threonine protein kinase